jgi:UDP-GlcNAc:undecaprenyl-phosphate GlcNAc-1-phosphate transferase
MDVHLPLLLLPLVAASLTAIAVTPLLVRWAKRNGLVDAPDGERRIHTTAVPRLGGVAIFLGIVVGAAVGALIPEWRRVVTDGAWTQGLVPLALVVAGMHAIGVVDDLRNLNPRAKLVATLAVAAGAWALGFRIDALGLRYFGTLELGWLSLPVTVLWIAGVTHAFNLIDGLDGLSGGLAVIALTAVGISADLLGLSGLLAATLILAGATFGFLYHNQHPARIFAGDGGALPLGAALAILTVEASRSVQSPGTAYVLFPLFVLAYPLFDTSLAMMRRWLRGLPMSAADRRHVHHQLLAIAPSYRWAIHVLYLVAGAAALTGILLRHGSRLTVVVTIVAALLALLALFLLAVYQLGYHELSDAGASVLSAARRARRVIRDKIHAREVAQFVREATSLAEVESRLERAVETFGFVHVQICRESSRRRIPDDVIARLGHVSRLDHPVTSESVDVHDPIVLRIWFTTGDKVISHTVVRFAEMVGPSVERWLARASLRDVQQVLRGHRDREDAFDVARVTPTPLPNVLRASGGTDEYDAVPPFRGFPSKRRRSR